jgi:hypothetical protein
MKLFYSLVSQPEIIAKNIIQFVQKFSVTSAKKTGRYPLYVSRHILRQFQFYLKVEARKNYCHSTSGKH